MNVGSPRTHKVQVGKRESEQGGLYLTSEHPFTSMETPCSGSMRNNDYRVDSQVELKLLKGTSPEAQFTSTHIFTRDIKELISQTTNPTTTRAGSKTANSYQRKAKGCRHQVNRVLGGPLHPLPTILNVSSDSDMEGITRPCPQLHCPDMLWLVIIYMTKQTSTLTEQTRYTLPKFQDSLASLSSVYASMPGWLIDRRSSLACQPEPSTSSVAQKAAIRLGLMMLQVHVQSIGPKSAVTKRRVKETYV